MKINFPYSFLLFSTGLLMNAVVMAQRLPYQDPSLSTQERSKDLISRLTLEEKASLMFDQSPAIP